MKDYEKALMRMEAVRNEIEEAAKDNRYISMTKACKLANVRESYIYRIIDNADEYNIPIEMQDKFIDTKDMLIDVMIQRVRECGEGGEEDSALRVARANLTLKSEQWLLKNLLPKKFGDNTVINVTNNNNEAYILAQQTIDQLDEATIMQIAKLRLTNANDK